MKRRTILTALVVILALAALSAGASAAPRDRGSCLIEFRAVTGFRQPVGGLPVMLDFDYESYRTSASEPLRLTIPRDDTMHAIHVLRNGIIWSGYVSCVTAGVIQLEAPIPNE
jgi:hypothetical protein